MKNMKTIPVRFPCDELTLEGEWLLPDGAAPFPAVVVCHPHPPSGGTMQNSVVAAIWQELAKNGIAALRFNFRGVGASQGAYDNGSGERDDVKAALDFAVSYPGIDKDRAGLAGYSFGAMMALVVAVRDERVRRLALVSGPLSDGNWQQIKKYSKPKIYLVGDKDQMVSLERFRQQTKDAPDPGQFQVISGADHSLSGYEQEVARKVSGFFAAGL